MISIREILPDRVEDAFAGCYLVCLSDRRALFYRTDGITLVRLAGGPKMNDGALMHLPADEVVYNYIVVKAKFHAIPFIDATGPMMDQLSVRLEPALIEEVDFKRDLVPVGLYLAKWESMRPFSQSIPVYWGSISPEKWRGHPDLKRIGDNSIRLEFDGDSD